MIISAEIPTLLIGFNISRLMTSLPRLHIRKLLRSLVERYPEMGHLSHPGPKQAFSVGLSKVDVSPTIS